MTKKRTVGLEGTEKGRLIIPEACVFVCSNKRAFDCFPLPEENMIWAPFKGGFIGILKEHRDHYQRALEEKGLKFNGVGVRIDGQIFDLIPPKENKSILREQWEKRRSQIISTLALLFMVGTISLRHINKNFGTQLQTRHNTKKKSFARHVPQAYPNTASVLIAVLEKRPKQTHLMEYHFQPENKRLTLSGRAKNYVLVLDYAAALQAHALFSHVQSKKANLVQIGGTSVVEFMLEALL